MSRFIRNLYVLAAALGCAATVHAQEGRLDAGFADFGVATPNLSTTPGEFIAHAASAVTVDAQDRILAVGAAVRGSDNTLACTIVRLLPNGALDTSFAAPRGFRSLNLGVAGLPNAVCGSVRSLDDGRIVVAGGIANTTNTDYSAFVAVLTASGALDTSFSGNGVWTAAAELPAIVGPDSNSLIDAVLVDSGGRLLVMGELVNDSQSIADAFLLRFSLVDGALDTAYGNVQVFAPGLYRLTGIVGDGGGRTLLSAMALDSFGRVLVLGHAQSRLVLFRLDGDDELDPSFGFGMTADGGNGRGFIPNCQFATDLLIDPQQRWLISCSTGNGTSSGVLRALDNGQLDLEFGIAGWSALPAANAQGEFGPARLGLQPDGKPILAGRFQVATAQQSLYGSSDAYVLRLLDNGQLDTSYGYSSGFSRLRFLDPSGGLSDTRAEQATAVAISSDGAAIIVGDRRTGTAQVDNLIARLNGPLPDVLFGNGFEGN